jgi:dolichyldiphosphatase
MANLRARKGASAAKGKQPAATEAQEPPDAALSTPLWLLKHTQGIVTAATTVGVLCLRDTHALYYVAGALGTGWTGAPSAMSMPSAP